ncbi:hypothetical protein HPB48_013038 [Haemaphysalis longicornis]|uniref:Uncharacterized protein n=1 Tax=Haemaphysalis longicornis TaxID=44386 RepID=A0A9J6GSV7_HAELO|nr:hypothetical protein HPB48_013038 [Haemaphysalis longicornis]
MPHAILFAAVAAVTFIAGIQQGYLATLKPVLVADYLGVQRVAMSWGLMGVAALPLTFCEPAIVGENLVIIVLTLLPAQNVGRIHVQLKLNAY